MTLIEYDAQRRAEYPLLAGVDEAGRGPLAGPVVAAAVILSPDREILGLNDSKKLTENQRNMLYDEIMEQALYVSVKSVDHEQIDQLNILQATILAMEQAVATLEVSPDFVLVDGDMRLNFPVPYESVVKGDATSASIAAASIIAKVTRDRYMVALDDTYPHYGFARHKGYPTKFHYECLDQHGPCPVHRESFLKRWRARREK